MPSQPSLRVIHILPRLTRGGAETMVLDLIKQASPAIEPLLVSLKPLDAGGEEMAASLGPVRLHVIGQRYPGDVMALWRLYRFLKKEQPSIIHTHLFGADLYGGLAARLAGLSQILSTEHSTGLPSGLRLALKRRLFRWSRVAVAVSEAVRQTLIARGFSSSKLRLIHNGVAAERFTRRETASSDVFRIGAIGRLAPEKNLARLIEAVAVLAEQGNVHCSIAGEGPLRASLEKLIKEKGLVGRVELVGRINDVPTFMSKLDAFVLPSLWEGMPLALLEAGAAGLPCVASDIPGVQEVISDGETGLLIDPQSSAAIAQSLERLRRSPEDCHRFGKALRQHVTSSFSVSWMAEAYEKLYREILSSSL